MLKRGVRFWLSRRGITTLILIVGAGLALLGGGVYALTNVWPGLGAQGIEVLRRLIGNEAVASIETFVFEVEDGIQHLKYQISGATPQAPWALSPTVVALSQPTSMPPEPNPLNQESRIVSPPGSDQVSASTAYSQPVAISAPQGWQPAPVTPLGSMVGEGEWSAYLLKNNSDQNVAYRTFLQPDPSRPYAVVSVVAFDLNALRLHFVLGSEEPQSPVRVKRTGKIPAADFQPDKILAAFNGGFKTEHGHFGVMVNGITVLPPRQGLGTVAIYADGRVQLGEWGTDITASPDISVWRQNGPLLIHDGQINPHTADNAPQDWGYTVKGGTATWRSALGLSADGRTLYYAAGANITLPALTQALANAGAAQAIQLDINNYWVHFDAFQLEGDQLQPAPLMDAMKSKADDRYVKGFTRDFFYVTLTN